MISSGTVLRLFRSIVFFYSAKPSPSTTMLTFLYIYAYTFELFAYYLLLAHS